MLYIKTWALKKREYSFNHPIIYTRCVNWQSIMKRVFYDLLMFNYEALQSLMLYLLIKQENLPDIFIASVKVDFKSLS